MNALDTVIAVIFLVTIILGLWKGFLRITISWLTVIAAFIFSSLFYNTLSVMLGEWIAAPKLRNIAAFIVIFLAIAFIGALVLWFSRNILKSLRLLWLDRLAGAGIGFAVGLTVSMVFIIVLTYVMPEDSPLMKQSLLAPYTIELANVAVSMTPGNIKDVFQKRRKKMKQQWESAKADSVTLDKEKDRPLQESRPLKENP